MADLMKITRNYQAEVSKYPSISNYIDEMIGQRVLRVRASFLRGGITSVYLYESRVY